MDIGKLCFSFFKWSITLVRDTYGKGIIPAGILLAIMYIPNPSPTIAGVGGIILFSIATWMFSTWHKRTDFYETRDKAPQVFDEILKAKEVWATWYSGTTVGSSGRCYERTCRTPYKSLADFHKSEPLFGYI